MLVHDAVRPFVDQDTIVGVIEAVKKYEAAIAGVPAIDTVKQVDRTSDGAGVDRDCPARAYGAWRKRRKASASGC